MLMKSLFIIQLSINYIYVLITSFFIIQLSIKLYLYVNNKFIYHSVRVITYIIKMNDQKLSHTKNPTMMAKHLIAAFLW